MTDKSKWLLKNVSFYFGSLFLIINWEEGWVYTLDFLHVNWSKNITVWLQKLSNFLLKLSLVMLEGIS